MSVHFHYVSDIYWQIHQVHCLELHSGNSGQKNVHSTEVCLVGHSEVEHSKQEVEYLREEALREAHILQSQAAQDQATRHILQRRHGTLGRRAEQSRDT